jgi:hypothetical protein
MIAQMRLNNETQSPFYGTTYNKPQYSAVVGNVQRIELHRGCPWHHEYCYEPQINEDFPIPEIVRNTVEILDMNFLVRKDALEVLKQLGEIRVNTKVVEYEFICGLDFRFLTQDIANQLKASRVTRPRLAWDEPFSEQKKIKKAVEMLVKAGYKRNELMLFMIVNWIIPYSECLRKLDLMKVWGVKVCDCCYDGGYSVAVPVYWTQAEISSIRRISRKHNQLVLFGINPQPTIDPTPISISVVKVEEAK